MNITINVDDVSLDSVIHSAYNDDEFGGRHDTTLGAAVARVLVDRLVKDHRDEYDTIARRIRDIRTELIREHIAPLVADAVEQSFQRTTLYGEPHGEPVTMRLIIMDEVKKFLTQPANDHGYRESETRLAKMVREMVQQEFAKVITEQVQAVRKQVSGEIGGIVAKTVEQAMKR